MSIECTFCKGTDITKKGCRLNNYGRVQLYCCKSCNRSFSENTCFQKMKHKGKLITTALDLYIRGVSLRGVKSHLEQVYGVKVSHVTILKWVYKYSAILKAFTNRQKIRGSGVLHADEMVVNVNGNWTWFWDVLDGYTRYITSTNMTHSRGMSDAIQLFEDTKDRRIENPETIITDSLNLYPHAIRKSFGRLSGVNHRKLRTIRDKVQNNKIERFHSTVRGRLKTMRGLKKMRSAQSILDLFVIFYNYLRPHESLDGWTPAKMSGINLPLEKGDRWMSLLKEASKERSLRRLDAD